MVRIGSTSKSGVDLAAFFVLSNPSSSICETTRLTMMRKCTSGQNAAALSYFWSYTLMIWRDKKPKVNCVDEVLNKCALGRGQWHVPDGETPRRQMQRRQRWKAVWLGWWLRTQGLVRNIVVFEVLMRRRRWIRDPWPLSYPFLSWPRMRFLDGIWLGGLF